MQLLNCLGGLSFMLSASHASFALARDQTHNTNITSQEATELALVYAYPLLAFKQAYLTETPLLGINHLGHARQLSTSASDYVVKPNVDTIYSTAIYDLSHDDLIVNVPAIPETQYALISFHTLYGDNYAILGKPNITQAGTYYLQYGLNVPESNCTDHEGESETSYKAHIRSPTTFGFVLIRWLVENNNINIIHSLQNATTVKTVPRPLVGGAYNGTEAPRLASVGWNATGLPPAANALRLLCQVGSENRPGQIAGNSTVGEILSKSGACASSLNATTLDLSTADSSAMAKADEAGQEALVNTNNGWSVVQSNLTGKFGTDYGLRMEISETGYLMLQAPYAVYPSWSNGTVARPMEGELLELGADESYIYTFSGKPPLRELGFWSLTAYDSDGFLIPNPRNVSSLGDRSNITYTSGGAVYGADSDVEQDGAFQLLIQAADVSPPANWTGNWLPGPSGGGNMTSLLRFFNAADELLNGTYQYPVVTKQHALV
jgi:hypothetical protein